jgi:hypothetical protein
MIAPAGFGGAFARRRRIGPISDRDRAFRRGEATCVAEIRQRRALARRRIEMLRTHRLTLLAVIAMLAVTGATASLASAASASRWSAARCTNYAATFYKLHAFPTRAQVAKANKVLKLHRCSRRVKRHL